MKEKIFTVTNQVQVNCAIWDNVKKPIGVIQIIHGIYDDIKAYNRFARFMNKSGYIVFGTDCQHCSPKRTCPNTFDVAVKLQTEIMHYLVNKYNLPIFIFGYGYGGFITQFILQHSDIPTAGVCLAGTGKYPRFLLYMAKSYAWICAKIFGANAPANVLNRISVGKHRARGRVKCTYGFYLSLFSGIENIKPENQFNSPILIISGANDNMNINARFSRALYNAYRDSGIMRLTLIIYPDASDNLLLQMSFGEISQDILDFFKYHNTAE